MNNDKTINQPSISFDTPMDILSAKNLEYDQKIKALENWKQTCIHLQESTGEGMKINNGPNNQGEILKNISNAMDKLKNNKS